MSNINVKPEDFTRINNDVNGNPRYVIHFLQVLDTSTDTYTFSIDSRYREALYRMKKLGGKKFHNKQFGGGIVFQSYNLDDLCGYINNQKDGK